MVYRRTDRPSDRPVDIIGSYIIRRMVYHRVNTSCPGPGPVPCRIRDIKHV